MKKVSKKAVKITGVELTLDQKLHDLMIDKLYERALLQDNKQIRVISEAIRILFPKHSEVVIQSKLFDACWKRKNFQDAIKIYIRSGRPFWHSHDVGKYYESIGETDKAMKEFERLMTVYQEIKILPLPQGPAELYKLAVWYKKRNPAKAKKFLTFYLRTDDKWKGDPAFCIPHKRQAERLLSSLS